MSSSSFVINVATDLGRGKINIGIRFPAPPSSLDAIFKAINDCFTQERRNLLNDPNARFTCIFTLINNSQATRSDGEKWIELSNISQIRNNVQLYAFDSESPPPERGIVPKAKKIVDAGNTFDYSGRVSASTLRGGGSASGSYDTTQKGSSLPYLSPNTAPDNSTASPPNSYVDGRDHMYSPSRTPGESFGRSDTAGSTFHSAGRGSFLGDTGDRGVNVVDRVKAREYLFEQLCRRTATATDASTLSLVRQHNGTKMSVSDSSQFITAQVLHNVLIQNEMFFPTDAFTDMTNNKEILYHDDWQELVEEFTPVIDVLYDRVALKSQRRIDSDTTDHKNANVRNRLNALDEEETALLARQVSIKEERARLKKELTGLEAKETSEKEDRNKEWDIINKFVNLKLKQSKLKKEERAITHQLNLL